MLDETSISSGSTSLVSINKANRAAYKTASRVDAEMRSGNSNATQIPTLDAGDILSIGELLGRGRFCHVCKVELRGQHQDFQQRHLHPESLSTNKKKHAIKFLRSELASQDHQTYCQGAAELVLELHLLSTLSHPNIITLEGVSSDGPRGFLCKTAPAQSDPSQQQQQQQQQQQHYSSSGLTMSSSSSASSISSGLPTDASSIPYFLILPRLQETLAERMNVWRELEGRCNSNEMRQGLFLKRLQVAHDVTSALSYLHARRIIYRDLNPTNLAFDGKGQIQLFDFGLARELEDSKLAVDGVGYHLGGNKGQLQYMAPEVALAQPYHLSADVYSLTVLVWQLCGLQPQPFYGLTTRQQYLQRVIREKERPRVDPTWSETLQYTLRSGWNDDADGRPPVKQMLRSLRGELEDLEEHMGLGGGMAPTGGGRGVGGGMYHNQQQNPSFSNNNNNNQVVPNASVNMVGADITANGNDSDLVSPLSLRSGWVPSSSSTHSSRFPPVLPFDKEGSLIRRSSEQQQPQQQQQQQQQQTEYSALQRQKGPSSRSSKSPMRQDPPEQTPTFRRQNTESDVVPVSSMRTAPGLSARRTSTVSSPVRPTGSPMRTATTTTTTTTAGTTPRSPKRLPSNPASLLESESTPNSSASTPRRRAGRDSNRESRNRSVSPRRGRGSSRREGGQRQQSPRRVQSRSPFRTPLPQHKALVRSNNKSGNPNTDSRVLSTRSSKNNTNRSSRGNSGQSSPMRPRRDNHSGNREQDGQRTPRRGDRKERFAMPVSGNDDDDNNPAGDYSSGELMPKQSSHRSERTRSSRSSRTANNNTPDSYGILSRAITERSEHSLSTQNSGSLHQPSSRSRRSRRRQPVSPLMDHSSDRGDSEEFSLPAVKVGDASARAESTRQAIAKRRAAQQEQVQQSQGLNNNDIYNSSLTGAALATVHASPKPHRPPLVLSPVDHHEQGDVMSPSRVADLLSSTPSLSPSPLTLTSSSTMSGTKSSQSPSEAFRSHQTSAFRPATSPIRSQGFFPPLA